MTPTQVCVLLTAVLAAGLGAPLARSAPAAAATPRLPSVETARPASRGLLFGQRLSAAAADNKDTAADSADSQPSRPPESSADGEQLTEPSDADSQTPRPPRTAPAQLRVTARPGVPVIGRSAVSRRRSGRRKPKIAPTVSSQTVRRATKRSDGFGRAKTTPSSRAASEPRPETPADSRPAAAAAPSPTRAGRSAAGDTELTGEQRSGPLDVEQEASGSSRVLTYHVQHTQHSRVAKSPRESPDFFVPPIRRRPSRRRVPLSAQTQQTVAGSGRSLGAQLAQQVRRQLAELQAQQQQQPASSTTERPPYQPPFVPTTPATTSKPYQHPFIPSSPTTTSEPYKHPFIPSPPTTTSEPYVHPFIPSSPTTTSEPYRHPFIPSSPTTTSEPYQHPHIPVPPESTRQPPVQLASTAALPGQQRQQQRQEPVVEEPAEEPEVEERPQARRVPSGSAAAVPRLHLPRTPAPTEARPVSSTAAPAPVSAAATIVHQQKVEAGFIVGEYGELGHSGGTVRGVKYAAESSVDRSLLEAALRQFLEL